MPYALTNCHNSLCAVGGTINEDDHAFGLSAAVKYGGIYVPANLAVIHQYAREAMAVSGGMILGSDSHTRYGPLGTMGFGEGGPEVVRQLLGDFYEIPSPRVLLVWLTGAPPRGVGPHDVALSLCGAVYRNGFARNAILEFAGPGVGNLDMDFRLGLDVMTTETACLSSVWATDQKVAEYLALRGRAADHRPLEPGEGACYDGMIQIDLAGAEPMAALPHHPSKVVPVRELAGQKVQQGIIAGCAGGLYSNIAEAAAILAGRGTGDGTFSLSVYPASVPINLELIDSGVARTLLEGGVLLKPAFCGPCFGAGDVPANQTVSIRHTTRNFPNREGARPAEGQSARVILMDARSIAATAANGGRITPATEVDYSPPPSRPPAFDPRPYRNRVYFGFGRPDPGEDLRYGPNIRPWPEIPGLPEDLEMRLAAVLRDPVTTTDELIPSGETSSYRSNPEKLAEFTLSRRDPEYVGRARRIRQEGLSSCLYAVRPGDGSAREQAASCQRVLGGGANICLEYATRRYRSNLINWGIVPFTYDGEFPWEAGERIHVNGIRQALTSGAEEVSARIGTTSLTLRFGPLSTEEREVLLAGCLMNYYRERNKGRE